MSFIQIIEYRTSRIEEIQTIVEKYRANRPDAPVTRGTVTKDRDEPNHYVTIVEFPSYEIAMQNSNRSDTDEMARQIAALCDEPPRFTNLDVVQTMSD